MFATSSLARTVVGTVGAAILASACMFVAVGPAAATPMTSQSRTVRFADLNLSQVKDRAVLDARIRSAAKSVCATGNSDLASRNHEVQCAKAAIVTASRS